MNTKMLAIAAALIAAPAISATHTYFITIPVKTPEALIKEQIIPRIALSATEFSFDKAQTGSSPTPVMVELENVGNSTAVIQSYGMTTDAMTVQMSCATLEPGESCTAYVYLRELDAIKQVSDFYVDYVGPRNEVVRKVARVTSDQVAPEGEFSGGGAFGLVPVGSVKDLNFTIKNTGIGRLSIDSIQSSGAGFSIAETTCAESLGVNGSCTVTARFTPESTADHNGTITVVAGNTAYTAPVSGVGQQSSIAITSQPIASFGRIDVGSEATSSKLTIKNNGNGPAKLAMNTTDEAFTITGSNCPDTLVAGGSCSLAIKFKPKTTGALFKELQITDGGTLVATTPISGLGSSSAVLLASNVLDLFNVAGGYRNDYYELSNTGGQPIELYGIDLTHPNKNLTFVKRTGSNECGSVLEGGAKCRYNFSVYATENIPSATVTAVFNTSAGAIRDTRASGRVSWSAMTPTPHNPSAQFGTVAVGSIQDSTLITLKNESLHHDAAAVSYSVPNGFELIENSCGASSARDTSCSMKIRFAPKTLGSFNGNLNITTTLKGGTPFTLSIPVSGVSVAPSATTWQGGASASEQLELGSSKTLTYLLYNAGAAASVNGVSVGGGGGDGSASLISTTCSGTLAAGGTCTAQVKVSPVTENSLDGAMLTAKLGSATVSTPVAVQAGSAVFKADRSSIAVAAIYRSGTDIASAFRDTVVKYTNTGKVAAENLKLELVADSGSPKTTATFMSNACTNRLAAGATCSVMLRMQSNSEGVHTGKMVFSSNSASVSIPYTASFAKPNLKLIAETPVKDTKVGEGFVATYKLSMNPDISGNLRTTVPEIQGNKGEFSIAGGTTCSGGIYTRTQSCVVKVLFAPTGKGEREPATLSLKAGNTLTSVTLAASGL